MLLSTGKMCQCGGASIIAGNAVGIFPDMKKTAKSKVNIKKRYLPQPGMREEYSKYVELYSKYTVELHDFFKRLQDMSVK